MLLSFTLALPLLLAAQTPQAGDKPSYRVVLSTGKYQRPMGHLMALGDSSIFIATKPKGPREAWREFPVRELQNIRIRKQGLIGSWVLRGAAAGLLSAIMVGVVSKDDPPGILSFSAADKAVISGIFLIPFGSVVGLVIGNAKQKKFHIGGNATKYARQRETLERYRYGP
jgi:hypothetical protein